MATTTPAATASRFFGTRIHDSKPLTSAKFQARFSFGGFGTKKSPPRPPKKAVPKLDSDDLVWFPGATRPEWLDGSMVGDRGFDPFGFAKPAEYLQFDLDSLDQNLAKNVAGDVIGIREETAELKPTPFQPYTEVFGLQRFRECELIHGRWAMLGTLGAIAVEALTGVAWQDAGKVELIEGASYLGQPLPFSLTTLIWIEVLPPNPEKFEGLQLAEIKHARLAMVAFLIFGIQAATTGKGPISFVATFNQ
ncbi:hypothetical protein Patl1_06590 [Pistacia atlantica]|uniref:Uncharacterized protein n=1 Tax=Pistacia atlantica TaxID=434234 RepID=A0ACC1BUZ2_9ROSI|nr:hypothetical protein Patl1_06590 [Pistacia atlantica]